MDSLGKIEHTPLHTALEEVAARLEAKGEEASINKSFAKRTREILGWMPVGDVGCLTPQQKNLVEKTSASLGNGGRDVHATSTLEASTHILSLAVKNCTLCSVEECPLRSTN